MLFLHELRRFLDAKVFDDALDAFGRAHAGKQVTTAEFQAHLESKSGKNLHELFDYWIKGEGLPSYSLVDVKVTPNSKGFAVEGRLRCSCTVAGASVPLTVVTSSGEETRTIALQAGQATFTVETAHCPLRLVLDKAGSIAKSNGGAYTVFSFYGELEHTLIVYGTTDEEASQREAAEALQRALVQLHANFTVPIKTDREISDADVQSPHLLLIGRPDSNSLVKRLQSALPIGFGSRSFVIDHHTYAHPGSAVIVAAENPSTKRYSLVVFAGLSAESTLDTATSLHGRSGSSAEVLVLPNKERAKPLVLPVRELVKELEQPTQLTSQKNGQSTGGR